MTTSTSLRLELRPTGDDTWLYAGSAATAFLTGDGLASGALEGPVRWSGRASRTDRWDVEIDGTITPAAGEIVGFTVSGFLLDGPDDAQPLKGGMRFRTADPGHGPYNRLYCVIDGTFDRSSGNLRLDVTP